MTIKTTKRYLRVLIFPAIVGLLLVTPGCDVEQTEEGEMPEVDFDVDASPGELPSYDVDWMNVDVKTRTETVTVPKVVIATEEEEIEVPYIEVNGPEGEEVSERTIVAEVEVKGQERSIDISEVWGVGNRLVVVSELASTGQDIGDKTMRVSDRLVLRAGKELDVRHYIIGERPSGFWNDQYEFVSSRSQIEPIQKSNARQIYG